MFIKLEAHTYSFEGKETGTVSLPENVFGVAWNADLVHEVVIAMQSNARGGNAHTKDRSEVRGGGRKPWKQKGTGRARHGSRRSPIWTGGGVTFGPSNEKNYAKKLNKNVRARALASVLSRKYTDGEILFVDSFGLSAPKTADAQKILTSLSGITGHGDLATKKKNAAIIVLPARDENTEKSFQNFGNVRVEQIKDINPVELLTYKYVVVAEPKQALEALEHRVSTKQARVVTSKSAQINKATVKK